MIKRSLGIRINGEQASFVELGRVMGMVRVLASGNLRLPDRGDGPPASPAKAEGTGSASPPFARMPDEVILGLPRRSIVFRSLELPAVENGDLAGLLAYEVERHLPFAAEEAWYGFQRIAGGGGKVKVLLAAARRADVDRQIEALGRLGLRPTAVDVSPFAAANAVLYARQRDKKAALGLIQLAEGSAEVSLVREGVLLSSRSIGLQEGSFEPILRELERLSDEGIQLPARLLVDGASAETCRDLAEVLGRPVEPWSRAPSPQDASSYGLALKGLVKLPLQINLLPQELRRKRERAVTVMFALLGLLAVLGGAWAATQAYRERETLSLLVQRSEAARAEAAEVESLKTELAVLRSRLQALEGIARERGRTLVILKELISLLPDDVALTELTLEGDKLQLRGTTSGSASELISALERSAWFENAAFTSPISTAGKDRQGFHLKASLKGTAQPTAPGGQPATGRGQEERPGGRRPRGGASPAPAKSGEAGSGPRAIGTGGSRP